MIEIVLVIVNAKTLKNVKEEDRQAYGEGTVHWFQEEAI
jgi:hypothetical protein